MQLHVPPGKYVVAVSGGVDSIVLLDMLINLPDVELVVAHFEHGMRPDAMEDCRLVEAVAARHALPFIYEQGKLGEGASEATARTARYTFLRKVQAEQGAQAIITAHHQDDVLETVILNLLRGTGRRGLSSLRATPAIMRPLLNVPKKELRRYATGHQLAWREDSTNQDERYLRNYLRLRIMPKMNTAQRTELLICIQKAAALNDEIDTLLQNYVGGKRLKRAWFTMLPHIVAREVITAWLRYHQAAFDRYTVERLTAFAKTAVPGKAADIDKTWQLYASKEYITLLVKSSTL